MLNISHEDTLKRWENLPEKIREALFSEENFNFIQGLSKTYSLPPKALTEISVGVSDVLHGFISQNELQADLSNNSGLGNDVVSKLCSDLKTHIFDSLEPELSSIYKPTTTKAGEIPNQTPTPTIKQTIVPVPIAIPPADTVTDVPVTTPAPFIIHQHQDQEELRPRIDEVVTSGSPIRPIFYNSPSSTITEDDLLSSKPVRARLELGNSEAKGSPAAALSRTKPDDVRRVNYSELRTKLDDPFAAKTIKTESGDAAAGDKDDEEEPTLKNIPL